MVVKNNFLNYFVFICIYVTGEIFEKHKTQLTVVIWRVELEDILAFHFVHFNFV